MKSSETSSTSTMGRSLMYVCMTLVGLFSTFASGLFEEQAGEFDWKIENIGEIQQSITEVIAFPAYL